MKEFHDDTMKNREKRILNEPHIMYPSLELIFLQRPQALVPVPANYC